MMARNMFCTEKKVKRDEGHAAGNILGGSQKFYFSYHENEENEENKGGEVDGSQHWIGLLDFRELKVSQDDTELCESAQKRRFINDRKEAFVHLLDSSYYGLTCWLEKC